MRRDRSLVLSKPEALAPRPQGPYRAPPEPIRVEVRLPLAEEDAAAEEWRRACAEGPDPLRSTGRTARTALYLGGCFLAGFFTGGRR